MGYLNKKIFYKSGIIAFLIIFAMIIRLPIIVDNPRFIYLNANLIYSLIYFGLFITWGISIKKRIIQKQTQRFLLAIVTLMVFWFLIRTIKFQYIEGGSNLDRWLSYAYYIPMILIPLISLFITLSLGKSEDYRLPDWSRLTFIPAITLIILVLTNDFHQLAYGLTEGIPWHDSNHEHGSLFWIIIALISITVLVSIVITIIKSRVPQSKKVLWLPLIPYIAGIIYAILYLSEIPLFRVFAGDSPTAYSFLVMAIFESSIQTGLIKSNIYDAGLFTETNLNVRILDNNNRIYYETGSMPIENYDDIRISRFPISGGHVVWLEDISEMNSLIKDIKQVNEILSEKTELLQAELELRERQIKIDEKTRILNSLSKSIEPQLQQLNEMLSVEVDPNQLHNRLIQLSLLGTYIKRRSNLWLLKEDNQMLCGHELEFCLRESIEVLSLRGINCSLKSSCNGMVEAKNVILMYDIFEEIIEIVLLFITDLFINLNISNNRITMKLQLNDISKNNTDITIEKERLKNINQLLESQGQCQIYREDNSLSIIVELPKGGKGL